MWVIVALVVIAMLIAAVGVAVVPYLTWKRLPEGAGINGMDLVKDGFVGAGVAPRGDHEVALVDPGDDVQGKAILAELSRRGLGPDDLTVILLTHGHSEQRGVAPLVEFVSH